MNKSMEKIEHLIWKDGDKVIHAICFVIDESDNNVKISLTKSYGEYIDTKEIDRRKIMSRESISPPLYNK